MSLVIVLDSCNIHTYNVAELVCVLYFDISSFFVFGARDLREITFLGKIISVNLGVER